MPYKINQQNERVVSVETSTEKKTRTVLCSEPANIHLLHHSDPKIKHTLCLKSSRNLRNFWLKPSFEYDKLRQFFFFFFVVNGISGKTKWNTNETTRLAFNEKLRIYVALQLFKCRAVKLVGVDSRSEPFRWAFLKKKIAIDCKVLCGYVEVISLVV